MHAPRRKTFNSVNAASLARWIVITGFLALTGLVYVYLTLQLYHLGDRKKALENELASLHSQNDVASVQIAALTSRAKSAPRSGRWRHRSANGDWPVRFRAPFSDRRDDRAGA